MNEGNFFNFNFNFNSLESIITFQTYKSQTSLVTDHFEMTTFTEVLSVLQN